MIQKHNNESVKQAIKEHSKVVIRFTAEWCGPCKAFAPSFNEVAAEDTEAYYLVVDADVNPELTEEFGVRGLPSVLFFYDGHLIGRIAGNMSAQTFRQKVKEQFNR